MLKKGSKKTIELIKEKLIDTHAVKLPIDDEVIHSIFKWFQDEEICLANAEADGETVDEIYFRDICQAVDELFISDEETVDLDDLNAKLKGKTVQ